MFAVLKRVKAEVKDDNVGLLAAGVAFYAMLAIFPAIIAVVTVYGMVADPDQVKTQVGELAKSLPSGADQLLTAQLTNVVNAGRQALSIGLVLSLLALLWSVSSGVQGLIKSLNVIYDEQETRGFVKLRGLSLLLTLGAIVVTVVALALITVFPSAIDRLGLGQAGQVAASVARWVVLAVLVLVALGLVYRLGPDRANPRWRWVSPGAVVALVLWLLGSVGFSYYVDNFGKYNQTYGALAAVIILLLWLFLSAFAVLLGAEFNAETERQTAADTTTGPDRPPRSPTTSPTAPGSGDGPAHRHPHLPPRPRPGGQLGGRLRPAGAVRGRPPGGRGPDRPAAPVPAGRARGAAGPLRRPAAGRRRRHRAGPLRGRRPPGPVRHRPRPRRAGAGPGPGGHPVGDAHPGHLPRGPAAQRGLRRHPGPAPARWRRSGRAPQRGQAGAARPAGRAGQPPGRGHRAGRGRGAVPPPSGPGPPRRGVPAGRLGAGRAGGGDRARPGLDRGRALASREHRRRRPGPAAAVARLRPGRIPAWTGLLAPTRRAGRVWRTRERHRVKRVGRSARPSMVRCCSP